MPQRGGGKEILMAKLGTNWKFGTTWSCSNPPPGWPMRIARLNSNTSAERVRQGGIAAACVTIVLSAAAGVMGPISSADPPLRTLPR